MTLSSFKAQKEVALFFKRPFSPTQNKASSLFTMHFLHNALLTLRLLREVQEKENTGVAYGAHADCRADSFRHTEPLDGAADGKAF